MNGLHSHSEERWTGTISWSAAGADTATSDLIGDRFQQRCLDFERTVNVYDADSELSRLNARSGRWVTVSQQLSELLHVCVGAAERTDGLVDPLVAHRLARLDHPLWGEQPGLNRDGVGIDWSHIELEPGRVRIPSGTALDLGALAKAWLADQLAAELGADFGVSVLINMAGDLAIGGPAHDWVVGVDPGRPDAAQQNLLLSGGGLATSGVGRRRWRSGGASHHHIIDPRSGETPCAHWWSVSVLAADALTANTCSTAAIILGEQAVTWLDHFGVDALLVAEPVLDTGTVSVGRWPVAVAS